MYWGYVHHGRWWLTWQLHALFPAVRSPLLSSVISSTLKDGFHHQPWEMIQPIERSNAELHPHSPGCIYDPYSATTLGANNHAGPWLQPPESALV